MSGADNKVAAIVLAAGTSTRLGQPKQLVKLGRETLLDQAVRVAREAGCSPMVVVLGAEAERIRAGCALDGAEVVINQRWRDGMAGSIRAGLAALHEAQPPGDAARGVLLMTCDQPAVTPGHLRALAASCEVAASGYAGRRGVPAYFPAAWFGRLAELSGDAGARELLRDAQAIPLESGELDIDSPEALFDAQRRFA